jgi:hypothetical protein
VAAGVIAEVVRGNAMPDLISYLFGPGRHNDEHVNQHLVAGDADAVFTADGRLWQDEPGTTRSVRNEARELGWQLEYPHSRWDAEVPHGYVWHCSLSIRSAEGQLTDAQWTQAAHHVIDALGFSGADGKAPCRWVAVRHGPSKEGNDHIHLAVNLVREDGTKASTWNDYRKAGRACAELEERFGLQPVPGRITGRSVPEPSRADREISAARGDPEPLRIRLDRKVRACAAAARSEAQFVALARQNGLLIRPRYTDDGQTPTVTGYAVADRDGRHACSKKTGTRGPVWFGGGKLATDLSLPNLRHRWEHSGTDPKTARIQALAAWSTAITLDTPPGPASRPDRHHLLTIGEDPAAAADLLAAAATTCEPTNPGPLSQAARHMARAAQQHPATSRNPEVMAIVADMASTFMTITQASAAPGQGALLLVEEVSALVDACAAKANTRGTPAATTATRDVQQASVLVRASLTALTETADQQARAALPATDRNHGNDRGDTMPELTQEDEFLAHLTSAAILGTRLLRATFGLPGTKGEPADVKALKSAGYKEHTEFDAHLRQELGEPRWAMYVADPARVVCAALITDGDKAGHDMIALLRKAAIQRAWENDARSPAKSIARVLAFRIKNEIDKDTFRRSAPAASPMADTHLIRTGSGASPSTTTLAHPATPYDTRLLELLGQQRWDQFATDNRRRDVAGQLTTAAAQGHNIDALLTHAVTSREWEDDPRSPSRRVAGVLHHRIEAAIASGEFKNTGNRDGLPSGVAQAVANAAAPAGSSQKGAAREGAAVEAAPRPRSMQQRSDQQRD